jgi:hypothetical protein
MYDIIGDVHGHASSLIALLIKLGYTNKAGVWSHPTRQLISLGDLIDRGPQQKEVVDIIKAMHQAGHAHVVMGNHEFNAVSWHLRDADNYPLRPHSDRNHRQHAQFLEQADTQSDWYLDAIAWFQSLPLLIEFDDFCCVHAAWDKNNINYLKAHLASGMTLYPEQWESANYQTHRLFDAIEYCLKGPDILLPFGHSFKDTNGITRNKIRLKWWDVSDNATFKTTAVSVPDTSMLPDALLPERFIDNVPPKKLVFFGHYWMEGEPCILNKHIVCLDWSVVKSDGHMVAYRFDGEKELDNSKLVWV